MDTIDRNRIVGMFTYLVTPIAAALLRRLPRGAFELDDLIQSGLLGLIAAAEAFGDEQTFISFAKCKIRGAILDAVRAEFDEATMPGLVVDVAAEATQETVVLRGEVAQAITRLPARQRQVIEIRLGDRTQREAGQALGITQVSARELELRAHATLAKALAA